MYFVLLKVVSQYDSSVLSVSVTGLQKIGYGLCVGWGELCSIHFFLWIFLRKNSFAKPNSELSE